MTRTLTAVDLFCGAGGTSTGLSQACAAAGIDLALTAINHWEIAVATHTANHPGARHLCASLDALNPRDLFGEGQLDLLLASPECTHHSVARGGRPINDQSRATAWCVVRWAEALRPRDIIVENVPEFETWGAIDARGNPMKSKKGAIFIAWIRALESIGYRVEWKTLCAADYGDPTTRTRLFVRATRGRRKLAWPEPTHSKLENTGFLQTLKAWRGAREIIDFTLPSQSIYCRQKPLSTNTLSRIYKGYEKYGMKPYIVPYRSERTGQQPRTHSLSEPLPTVTAGGVGHALVEPYLISYYGNGEALSLSDPLDTVTTKDRFGLVQPIVRLDGKKYLLDFLFRMLQPCELAAAQGFPADYKFSGGKTQTVKQIGNAVPVGLARSLSQEVFNHA